MGKQVVKYDLHISETSGEGLYLVKTPAVESRFNPDSDDVLDIKFKPGNKFCQLLATTITKSDMIEKFRFVSSTQPINDTQLFVGKILTDSNVIVLNRLDSFMTFRRDFSHLDPKDEIINSNEDFKPVTVKFSTPGMDKKIRPMMSSDPEEQFVDLTYHNCKSYEACEFRRKMQKFKGPPPPNPIVENQTPKIKSENTFAVKEEPLSQTSMDVDLPTSLVTDSATLEAEHRATAAPSEIPRTSTSLRTKNHVSTVNPRHHIQKLLTNCFVASFDEIKQSLEGKVTITDEKLATIVSDLCLMVQGNWVIKSEILYPDINKISPITGIKVENVILARDYLIWLFTQSKEVSRPEFTKKSRIPDQDAIDLLSQLSRLDQKRRIWVFKLEPDDAFQERHPEIAKKQLTCWRVIKSNKLAPFFSS